MKERQLRGMFFLKKQPIEWPPVSASILFSAAATGSHLRPIEWPQVAAGGHQHLVFHRQSLAASCSHSSGRQWPPAFSFHRQPLAATCSQSSGRKWPPEQVAASGRQSKWPQVAARANGRKWPPLPKSNSFPSARSLQIQIHNIVICNNHIYTHTRIYIYIYICIIIIIYPYDSPVI